MFVDIFQLKFHLFFCRMNSNKNLKPHHRQIFAKISTNTSIYLNEKEFDKKATRLFFLAPFIHYLSWRNVYEGKNKYPYFAGVLVCACTFPCCLDKQMYTFTLIHSKSVSGATILNVSSGSVCTDVIALELDRFFVLT